MNQQNDKTLVEKSLKGDRDAFAKLVAKYSSVVATVAFSKLGNFQDVEDVLQECFLRAWSNLPTLREKDKFVSWLYGITGWVCRERIRQRQYQSLPQDVQDFSILSNPPEEESKKQRIQEAIQQLPEIYREAILLLYFEKKSYKEIADILGISKAGVNFRLTKARLILRKYLSEPITKEL